MLIIGFCNLKGGVGKTTACQNVAVGLARSGKRVAVLDMDPQSNLSASFGISVAPGALQIFDLLSREARWDDVVSSKEGVDIIPSSLDLVMAELHPEGAIGKDTLLRETLALVDPKRYDFILLDSPPQLGVFTRNVLTASNLLVVPMDGGFYARPAPPLHTVAFPFYRARPTPRLAFVGTQMTRHNPNVLISREVASEVRSFFGNLFFSAYIRQNVSLIEASSLGMSVFAYDPTSNGAHDYKRVTAEFLERCQNHG